MLSVVIGLSRRCNSVVIALSTGGDGRGELCDKTVQCANDWRVQQRLDILIHGRSPVLQSGRLPIHIEWDTRSIPDAETEPAALQTCMGRLARK